MPRPSQMWSSETPRVPDTRLRGSSSAESVIEPKGLHACRNLFGLGFPSYLHVCANEALRGH